MMATDNNLVEEVDEESNFSRSSISNNPNPLERTVAA